MQEDNQKDAAEFTYTNEDTSVPESLPATLPEQPETQHITWTGSEFLDRHKDVVWYLGLAASIIAICAFIYFVSKDYISVIFVAVMGLLFGIVASRKPKQLQYTITNQGIEIGKRSYKFGDFKSFSLQRDGVIGYINLLPLKRLATELSIYYAPEDEQRIYDALSEHIPHEQIKESMVDRLFKAVHF